MQHQGLRLHGWGLLDAMTRCWLDIDIGDPEAHAQEVAAHDRALAFFDAVKDQVEECRRH